MLQKILHTLAEVPGGVVTARPHQRVGIVDPTVQNGVEGLERWPAESLAMT